MYAYIDRPVASLAPADRLVLDAMRSWAFAAALGRDRVASTAARLPVLAHSGAIGALDAAMILLDGAAGEPIALQRPCHDRVEEDEAILLAVADLVGREAFSTATVALARIVGRATAATVVRHLVTFHRRLDPALQG